MARPPRKRGVSRGPQRQSQTAWPWTSWTREATPSVPQASASRAQPLSQCIIGVHTHATAWRALKELLREVFLNSGGYARVLLLGSVAMATRSGLAQFIKLASRIRAHQAGINAAPVHVLSNARVESANNKLRLLTRIAFGFHSPAPPSPCLP